MSTFFSRSGSSPPASVRISHPPTKPSAVTPIDILIIDGGSILLLQPETDAGREWLAENVSRDGYQPYLPTVLCEPRYLMEIVLGARRNGLVVEAQS